MIQSARRWTLGAFLLLVLGSGVLRAQTVSIASIDPTTFPTLSASVYAFDAAGVQQNLTPADLALTENGVARRVLSVTCPPQNPPRDLSSVLVVDASGSMAYGPGLQPNIDLARAAARAWVNALPLGASECALTSFDHGNALHQDFTVDRTRLLTAIAGLEPEGGTDYNMALLNPVAGGLQISRRGVHKRVIVFLTDGMPQSPTDVAAIIAEADRQDCAIYVVTLGMPCPQELRDIAGATDASWYENVTSVEQAEQIYREILFQARSSEPCRITWETVPCPDGIRNVELAWNAARGRSSYVVPAGKVASLSLTPGSFYMRAKPVGVRFDTTLTVTAVGSPFVVSSVTSTNPAFTVAPTSFTLAIGESRTLTVSYTPVDSNYAWSELTIESDLCPQTFFASASYPARRAATPTIHLDHPNGGETFFVGSDTTITWSGIAPSDTVLLEYSTDDGATWRSISDRAVGGRYDWKVPNTPSTRCLGRVTRALESSVDPTGLVHRLRGQTDAIYELAWSPDGTRVVTVGDLRAIVWSAITGRKLFEVSSNIGQIVTVDWSRDGQRIVTGSTDMTARVWDANNGAAIATMTGHGLYVVGARFNPAGTRVATASYDGEAKIWNAATGALIATGTPGAAAYLRVVEWSPDGTKIACASDEGIGYVYNASTGALLYQLVGHNGPGMFDIQWNPSGTRLLTCAFDLTARVWNATNGALMTTMSGHTDVIYGANWSPDGTRVVTASADGTARVWNASNGQRLLTLSGHGGEVGDGMYSPDGTTIATFSIDGTAILWDATTGAEIFTFMGHSDGLTAMRFSPDGSRLATGSFDTDTRIWELPQQPTMIDRSDAVFTILAPAIVTLDVDMGTVVVGDGRDSTITSIISGTTAAPFTVDSITIVGADAAQFSLVSGLPPFVVPGNGSRAVELRFRPAAVGSFTAQINFYTSSGRRTRTIRGIGVEPSIAVDGGVIDFGSVSLGDSRDTLRAVTVRNAGGAPVQITGVRHAGPNDVDFVTIASATGPLQPGESALVDLRFTPSIEGRTSGRLLFDFDGPGSPATVMLFGEGVAPVAEAEVVSTEIDFGTVDLGDARDSLQAATIRNVGTIPITILSNQAGGADAGDFIVVGNATTTIAPGDTARIDLRFVPGAIGPRSGELLVDYGVSEPAKVLLRGVGVEVIEPSLATLRPGDAAARAGDTVEIPIVLDAATNLAASGATGFATTLRFNGTLLEPIDDTPRGAMAGFDRIIPLTLTLPAGADGVLATLRFRVGLGNDTVTALLLEGTQALDGPVTMSVEVGRFTLTGICLDGGPRLINPMGTIALKLSSNPARARAEATVATVELGRTTLTLTDVTGRSIRTFVDGEMQPGEHVIPLDLRDVGSGMYLLQLRTETEQRTILMEVTK
ncbi:MAG TPA: choice-of-anchor D domain-containing protein [Candidatus Kapabacteria bacterium]|nr:choice-of-anchor D domain-containing protein [Candidatus Kapabacteria bacterium]